ncbi:MAG: hypothetical protein LUH46_02045, partial [Alistipes sp.]|nr:hypothetical protein [Alistipes sp.]
VGGLAAMLAGDYGPPDVSCGVAGVSWDRCAFFCGLPGVVCRKRQRVCGLFDCRTCGISLCGFSIFRIFAG